MTPLLEVRAVRKTFGSVTAVDIEQLEIRAGEMVAVLGASGCGKSTLLRLLAGLEQPDSGSIHIRGVDATSTKPEKRPVNMVFQSYALFPHLTVEQNICYGPKVAKMPADEVRRRCAEITELVQLKGLESRLPEQLSGGQQQRVALARALVMKPAALLLDEPLAALDANLREQMRSHLCELQRTLGIAFVLVTHDQSEALQVCQRLAFMHEGRIMQTGTPEEVYQRPCNLDTARFIGKMSFFDASVKDGRLVSNLCNPSVNGLRRVPNGQVTLGLRPESLRLAAEAIENHIAIDARLERLEFNGSVRIANLQAQDGSRFQAQLSNGAYVPDGACKINWLAQDMLVFDGDGKAI